MRACRITILCAWALMRKISLAMLPMPNYVDTARAVIDDAIAKSRSYADFKYVLRQMGAYFDDSENHKYTVLRVKGYRKNIRLARLGDEYSLDRIKERIYDNRNSARLEPFQKGEIKSLP